MRFERPDKEQKAVWDKLVETCNGGVFSLSAYLDATAVHWEILWNADKTGGMACPYTLKLGVKTLYAPFFHRYVQWLGEGEPKPAELVKLLKSHFEVAAAHYCSQKHFLFSKRVFQELRQADYKPNQQVKRMLKKAAEFTVVEQFEPERLLKLVKEQLSGKLSEIDDYSMQKLNRLVHAFSYPEIIQLNLLHDQQWCGGIWIMPFGERILYLKGATTAQAKESGGMYKLIEHAIRFAFSHNGIFDFGGSNAAGVKRFNTNWGAQDSSYYYFRWNNAPFWWNWLRKGKNLWKK